MPNNHLTTLESDHYEKAVLIIESEEEPLIDATDFFPKKMMIKATIQPTGEVPEMVYIQAELGKEDLKVSLPKESVVDGVHIIWEQRGRFLHQGLFHRFDASHNVFEIKSEPYEMRFKTFDANQAFSPGQLLDFGASWSPDDPEDAAQMIATVAAIQEKGKNSVNLEKSPDGPSLKQVIAGGQVRITISHKDVDMVYRSYQCSYETEIMMIEKTEKQEDGKEKIVKIPHEETWFYVHFIRQDYLC